MKQRASPRSPLLDPVLITGERKKAINDTFLQAKRAQPVSKSLYPSHRIEASLDFLRSKKQKEKKNNSLLRPQTPVRSSIIPRGRKSHGQHRGRLPVARSTCSPSRQQKRNHNSRNQLKSDGANTNTRRTIKSRSKVCKSGTANLSNDSSGRDTHTNSVQYDANERDDYQRKADMQMQKFGRRVDFDLLEATKRLAATHCNDEPTNIENKVRAFKLRSRIRAERVQKRNDAHRVRAMNEWIGHLVDRDIKMKKTIAEVKTTKKEQPQSKMLITQPFSPSSSSLVSLPLHLSSPLQPSVSRLRPPPSSPSSSLSSSLEETTKKKSKNRAIKKKRDGQDYNTGIAILSPPSSFPPRSPFHRTGRDMARESLHSQYQEQLLQQTLRRFPINARVQVHERKGSVMYVGFLRACGEGIWVVIDLDVPHTMHQYLPLIESDSMCLPIHRDNLCELQELAECIDLCTGHTNIIGEKENEEVNCDVGNHTHGNEKGLHTLPYEQDDKNNTNDDNKTTRMTKEDRKGAGDDNLRAKFRRMLISRVKYVKYADTYRHTSTHDEGGSARNINERADKYSYNQSNNNQTRQNMPISSDTECSVTSRLIKHCILIQRWFRHCLIVRAHARVRAHRYAYLEEYTAVDEHALRTPLPTIPTSSSSLSASSLVSNWTTHSHNHNFTQSHEVYQSHEQYHEHQTHNDYNRYGNLHAHTGNKDYCHTQSRSSLVEHELYESVISALSEFLTSALDIDTPMKKVRAIFTYLCHRISVDADPSLFTEATLSSSSPSSLSSTTATAFLPSSFGSRAPVYMHQKILHILRTGVADSEGMADIFCALVQACGFLCYKVEGVCKLDKDHIDAVYAHSNHYWNIVLVGKRWCLMDLPLSGGYWRGGWRKRFSSAYFDCDPAYFILHHYPVRCSAFDARTRAGHTAQDHADGIVRDLNTDAAVYGERNTTVAPEYDASINTDHDPLPASLRMSTQNHVPMCGHRNDVHRAMHANMRDSVKSSPRHFPNHTALQLITRPLTLTAFECNTHTQRTFIEQKIRMLFPRHTHTIVHHSAFYSIALVIPMHMELEAELKFIDNAIDNKCTTETREYDISHHNYDCNNNSENNGNNNNNNCSSNDDKKHKHAGKEFSSNNIFSAAATSKVLSTVACTLVQTLYKERARDDNTNANSNMGARANTNVNSITGCNSGDQSSTRMKMSLMDQKYEQQAHVRLVFPTKGEYTLILRTRRRTPAPHNSDSESKAIKPGCIAPAQEIMRLRFIIQGGVYDLYHNHYDVQVGFLTKVPIDFKRDGTDRYGGNSGGKRRGCEASISSLSQTSKQLLPRRRGYHNLFRLVHPRSGVFILNHQNKPKPPKKKSRLRFEIIAPHDVQRMVVENNGTWLELHPTPSIGDTDVTSPKDLDQNNRFDAYSDRYSVYTGSMELAHQQHPHSHRQGKRFTGSMDPLTNHRLQVFYQRYSYSSSTVDDNSVSQCNTDEILKRVSSHTPPAPFHRLYQLGGHCNDRRNKKSSSGRSSGRNSRKTGEGGCLDAQLFSEVKEDHVQVHPSCLAFTAGLQLINIEKFENTDSTTVSSSVYRRHSLKDLTFTVLIRGKSNHTGARQGNESTEKTIQYASINTLGERFDEGDTEEERDDERNEKNVDVKAVVRTGWQTGVYSSTHSCRKELVHVDSKTGARTYEFHARAFSHGEYILFLYVNKSQQRRQQTHCSTPHVSTDLTDADPHAAYQLALRYFFQVHYGE